MRARVCACAYMWVCMSVAWLRIVKVSKYTICLCYGAHKVATDNNGCNIVTAVDLFSDNKTLTFFLVYQKYLPAAPDNVFAPASPIHLMEEYKISFLQRLRV